MSIGSISFLLMGVALGLIGGGGSILTVPILVYFFKQDPLIATANSLVIVGFAALVGGLQAALKRLVDFKAVLLFSMPSFLGVVVARKWILPSIPQQVSLFSAVSLDKSVIVMLAFAIVMLTAALKMITTNNTAIDGSTKAENKTLAIKLLFYGLIVGLVAGFVGAGGGFLIVPALTLILKIPTRTAIGSSLFIIFIQSTLGFFASHDIQSVDWKFLSLSVLIAALGIFMGSYINQFFSENKLKVIFGYFVLLMGLIIVGDQLLTLKF